jgi:2-polyprenyl-3-methyl-5-hydroxy-6-metoxy-1,4-benzoquinol methylase
MKNKEVLEVIGRYCSMFGVDRVAAENRYKEVVKHYKGVEESPWALELRNKWYHSIEFEDADYSLYGDEFYFCDLLACFNIYSSQYIKKIDSLNLDVKSCLDLGCGLGLTTQALKGIGIKNVAGTNLKETPQYEFCKSHIDLFTDHKEAGVVDMIFASEYFEHIWNAGDHLLDVIEHNQPKYLIMANAFNAKSFGHFDYFYNGQWAGKGLELDSYIHCKKMGRMFSQMLKSEGYSKLKTGFWNDRPNVWVKQ